MAVYPSRKIVLPQLVNIVNYIESHGTEWINTGIIANQDTEIYAGVMATETQTAGAVIAAEQTYEDRMFGIDIYGCFYGSQTCTWSVLSAGEWRSCAAYKGYFWETETQFSWEATRETFQTPVPLTIFGFNTATGVTQLGKLRLRYLEIKNNGELVREFVPCKDGNGVPCLYDRVSRQFFYNQGTGTFGYG